MLIKIGLSVNYENFRKFISLEYHIKILIWSVFSDKVGDKIHNKPARPETINFQFLNSSWTLTWRSQIPVLSYCKDNSVISNMRANRQIDLLKSTSKQFFNHIFVVYNKNIFLILYTGNDR